MAKYLTLFGLVLADIAVAIVLLVLVINMPSNPASANNNTPAPTPTSIVGSYTLDYISYGGQTRTADELFADYDGEYIIKFLEDGTGELSTTIIISDQSLTESVLLDWDKNGTAVLHYDSWNQNTDKTVAWQASDDYMSICLIVPQDGDYGTLDTGDMCFKRI